MSTELLAHVTRIYDAYSRGDIETVLGALHQDVTLINDVPLPWGGRYSGPQGVADFFGRLLSGVDTKIEVEELFVSGDSVVQIGRTRGTVRSTGKPFDAREIHIWRFRDGLVSTFQVLLDSPQMQQALS
jgi:uncharacterized protein